MLRRSKANLSTRYPLLQRHLQATLPCIQTRSFGVRHKVVELEDAVSLVKSFDTVCVSGFVCQSAPEALCRGLAERFTKTGNPRNLQLLFQGGPGDFQHKGLSHFGKEGMVRAAIGAHFGQVPELAQLVLDEKIPGWALPMGSISHMIREAASHSPGYISRVGLGTMVDPRNGGGALNNLAKEIELVKLMEVDGHEYLRYPSIPINVAFIRGTTADPEGNITFEHESILGDVKNIAIATRSSGGVVIAQVERIAANGSLPSRNVHIPGTFVDCVVVADKSEHGVSFFTLRKPVWTGEYREPVDDLPIMPMNQRKIISRRGAMELEKDDIVNLGIGMPEGVANVASEEGIFEYVTLTTEAGVIGGVGASGVEFGPASNPIAFVEQHQQFDLYNGGGLSICFLGMAECSFDGNVNVSRLSPTRLTGPGGFIDITQCTHKVVFMGTFSKSGLEVETYNDPETGKPKLRILKEGKFFAVQDKVLETTFSAQQAKQNGQKVLYVTERCVFELHYSNSDKEAGLKLIEIAPGIDLQKDILDHMPKKPYIEDASKLKIMDSRIFCDGPMNLYDDMFDIQRQFAHRIEYNPETHVLYLDLRNQVIVTEDEIDQYETLLESKLKTIVNNHPTKSKVRVIVNYDNFDCKAKLIERWSSMADRLEKLYYSSVSRYSGQMFMRKKLLENLKAVTDDDYWEKWTKSRNIHRMARNQVVEALASLNIHTSHDIIAFVMGGDNEYIERSDFHNVMKKVNFLQQNHRVPSSPEELESIE